MHQYILRACLIIRESKRNLMKMRTYFHKFSVNSRTIRIKFGRIGAIFMRLQPIHQLSNKALRPPPKVSETAQKAKPISW